jgi:hypothetical protein
LEPTDTPALAAGTEKAAPDGAVLPINRPAVRRQHSLAASHHPLTLSRLPTCWPDGGRSRISAVITVASPDAWAPESGDACIRGWATEKMRAWQTCDAGPQSRPPGPPEVQMRPGMASELLRELAPLLAGEGIDIDNLDVPDLDTLQQAMNRAIERQNMVRFTPVGQAPELAAVTLRLAAEAIADGDTRLAAAVLDQAQPESSSTAAPLPSLPRSRPGRNTPARPCPIWRA